MSLLIQKRSQLKRSQYSIQCSYLEVFQYHSTSLNSKSSSRRRYCNDTTEKVDVFISTQVYSMRITRNRFKKSFKHFTNLLLREDTRISDNSKNKKICKKRSTSRNLRHICVPVYKRLKKVTSARYTTTQNITNNHEQTVPTDNKDRLGLSTIRQLITASSDKLHQNDLRLCTRTYIHI